MRVECKIVKCVLKGDEFTELRVSFKEYLGVRVFACAVLLFH